MDIPKPFWRLKIVLEPEAGATRSGCMRSAALLALREGAKVEFTHNGVRFSVHPAALEAAVKEEAPSLA